MTNDVTRCARKSSFDTSSRYSRVSSNGVLSRDPSHARAPGEMKRLYVCSEHDDVLCCALARAWSRNIL